MLESLFSEEIVKKNEEKHDGHIEPYLNIFYTTVSYLWVNCFQDGSSFLFLLLDLLLQCKKIAGNDQELVYN